MALPVERLAMVYDADGGFVGEARYVIGHLLGRAECALCDITHGSLRRKSAFDGLLAGLAVLVDVVHRNEQSADVAAATAGHLPCVAALAGGQWSVVVTAEELHACEGDVARFQALLKPFSL